MTSHDLRGPQGLLFFVVSWASFMLVTAPFTQAHQQRTTGPYQVVIGWAVEPVIVGERNALTVDITQDNQPVQYNGEPLILEVQYAGRTRRTPVVATATPGLYQADIVPTVRGQYTVQLTGTIEGGSINTTVEPEEVRPATHLHFPETQPAPLELQAALTTLGTRLQSVRTWAIAGMMCGALGILAAVIALFTARHAASAQDTQRSGTV